MQDDGAPRVMLYATCGRTAVYQIQNLMRMIHSDAEAGAITDQQEIANTRDISGSAPKSNWFKRGED